VLLLLYCQVQVLFALPDRTLLLKRPPKNRLPLVDFSYRPLFMCLSIDNVLTLFGCLLTEAKVSNQCSYISILSIACSGLLQVSYMQSLLQQYALGNCWYQYSGYVLHRACRHVLAKYVLQCVAATCVLRCIKINCKSVVYTARLLQTTGGAVLSSLRYTEPSSRGAAELAVPICMARSLHTCYAISYDRHA
jgi:DENN (AEX-3) domain